MVSICTTHQKCTLPTTIWIKPNRDNPEYLEIILKVNISLIKFTVDKTVKLPSQAKKVNLSEMNDLTTSQVISVVAKVTQAEEPAKIVTKDGKTLTKQDVHIADATGSTRIVLREGDVSSLEVEKLYSLIKCHRQAVLGGRIPILRKIIYEVTS